ncbi:MAG TPA: hypothetical protein VFT84_07150, partial [Gemmatimonadales bacterium]|nr:hypothetical protein [Gemmatimonadales bacterium]
YGLFRAGAAVELYYEMTGAIPGGRYRHEIAVFRAKGDGEEMERRPVVALAFDEPADATLLRSRRTLQLGRLKPGRYVVEVRVSGEGDATAPRRRAFRIVPADAR